MRNVGFFACGGSCTASGCPTPHKMLYGFEINFNTCGKAVYDNAHGFGMRLSKNRKSDFIAEAEEIAVAEQQRVEIGTGAAALITEKFIRSAYVTQESFAETIAALVDIFYEAKEESFDMLSDDEIADIMFYFFEHVSEGSTELLQGRDMEEFCRSIRNGGISFE